MVIVRLNPDSATNRILNRNRRHGVKRFLQRMWREQEGVLSFEWTVLTSLLTVGVVSGIASVRDAAIDEMGDLAQAMISLDQSFYIQPPLAAEVHTVGLAGWGYSGGWGYGGVTSASGSQFVDAASFRDCYRTGMKVQEFPRRGQPAPGSPVDPLMPPAQAEPAL
jgi:Flp pilus assembly pilin Flp